MSFSRQKRCSFLMIHVSCKAACKVPPLNAHQASDTTIIKMVVSLILTILVAALSINLKIAIQCLDSQKNILTMLVNLLRVFKQVFKCSNPGFLFKFFNYFRGCNKTQKNSRHIILVSFIYFNLNP